MTTTTPTYIRPMPLLLLLAAAAAAAQTREPVIEPQIDRREVRIPRIDVDDFEIGVYGGVLSVQDFGANGIAGVRLGYHLTEDFFVEAALARSTVSDESFRDLGIPIFTERETDLDYYHISVGYNLFPGEVFFGDDWAMTSTVYLAGGVGVASFNGEDNVAFNFGIGIRVLPTDWLAVRTEIRDVLFESDLVGRNEIKHNFELTVGVSVYF